MPVAKNSSRMSSAVARAAAPQSVDFEAYAANGYMIVPGIFSAAECDELVAAAKTLPSFVGGSTRPAMQPHRSMPAFYKAMAKPELIAIMERLVGGRVSGLQSEFFYCRPGTKGFARHQDNFFVQADPNAFASAWAALTDVRPENGGLIVYPGTHRGPLLPVEPTHRGPVEGQDSNATDKQTIVPANIESVDTVVPKGAVVFLHAHIVHASHDNRSADRWRYALLNTYIRRGCKFNPGGHARRSEVDVYTT
ncbi:MAG TPA: phytanoyl-CoA dioxygenase family protein [Alphaproteobacteria bacterium]|nr:phytanoyl-CoA dioxygenase family protein [Alphaproteobacteria bacterium]